MARLFSGLAWFFAFATVGSLIVGELSDDPEYYVPVIAATIAVASALLAGRLRRNTASRFANNSSDSQLSD